MFDPFALSEDPITPHDWEEDFPLEDGSYYNTCTYCGEEFVGHKRRTVCKVCHRGPKKKSRILVGLAWLGILTVLGLGFCAIAVISGGQR